MAHRVLIISPSAADIGALVDALDGRFDVESTPTLAEGLRRVRQGGIDAVVADMALPDSQGLAGLDQIQAVARATPVLVLCARDDEADAMAAVRRGARGWLSKGCFDDRAPQSLRIAIERSKVEQGVSAAQERAAITLDSIGDAVVSVDPDGRVDYLNVAAERITGWAREEALGVAAGHVLDLVDGASGRQIGNPLDRVLRDGSPVRLGGEPILVARHGLPVPIEDSAAPILDRDRQRVGAVMVFRDISDMVARNARMRHQAQHDFLTSLPNRVLLNDRIAQSLAQARRGDTHPVLLFLDLDKFKHINDSLGHVVGDGLLQAVARRLVRCVRNSDTVSRHGGDEFVILLAGERRPRDAALTAEKILLALAAPFQVGGHELHTSTSIGISVFPLDGADAATLIKNADTAMYHAKERGRNNYQFFRQEMNTRAVERQLVESALRRGLERAEFRLHYQPRVDLHTRRIAGVEALLRWDHPEWGLVLPERFIAIAEECGLIIPIGRWALGEACAQAMRWRADGIAPVSVAVNVSDLEFHHRDFFDQTKAIFDASGVDPACVGLELTESALMRDVDRSAGLLGRLKAMGVQVAVDDFGTGYSSLGCLSQLPIDVLKIDQSFVKALGGADGRHGEIVSAAIDMGRNLRQRVVAEGVESTEQLAFLSEHGCNEGQGYLFGHPVDGAGMGAMLQSSMSA